MLICLCISYLCSIVEEASNIKMMRSIFFCLFYLFFLSFFFWFFFFCPLIDKVLSESGDNTVRKKKIHCSISITGSTEKKKRYSLPFLVEPESAIKKYNQLYIYIYIIFVHREGRTRATRILSVVK